MTYKTITLICVGLSILRLQSVTKIMGKTAIWPILCFYPLLPLNNVKTMSISCVKLCYGFDYCIRGREILNTLFKIPIIFCH